MSFLAIITARGGSKRIPNKNIRPFCGKPILAYSVEAALKSALFDEVMVSTDSEQIAEMARSFGASVPFMRSRETSDDHATTADVVREVLMEYQVRGDFYDTFCCLYPTAPFITAEKLKNASRMLAERDADSVIPVVRFSFPPQRAFVCEDGLIRYIHPEHERSRSQDLPPVYHDCGQFYVVRTIPFLERNSIVLPRTVPFEQSELEVQDIDNETDWKIAELKYRMFSGGV